MPENTVGDEQVEGISRRLAEIQGSLPPDQAALLSGIFSVAADAIRPTGSGVGTTAQVSEQDVPAARVTADDPVPLLADQFRQQFLGAFTPAPSAEQEQEEAPRGEQELEEGQGQQPAPHALSAMIIPRRGIIPGPDIIP
jgi:hypothetical protein